MPNGKCRMHGGKALTGSESPTWKTGKYSRFIPDRLAENYEERREDKARHDLRDELALIDSRVADLLNGADHGASGELWKAVQEAAFAVHTTQADDATSHTQAIENLLLLVAQGKEDWRTWEEIRESLEQRRKLVDTEIKRVATAHKILTQEQSIDLINRIKAIVLQFVTNEEDRRAIAQEFRKLAMG